MSSLNPMTRKKERIDALAESTADGGQVREAGKVAGGEGTSLLASAWKRLRRNPAFLIGAFLTILVILVAIFAPWLAPHDPAERLLRARVSSTTNPVPGPEPGFPLGADGSLGRDMLSRLIWASRQTLQIGFFATILGFVVGTTLGTLAGALGGWVDTTVMRIVDLMLSVPSILMAVSIATLFGAGSNFTLILAIGIVQIPIFARLLRGSMLAQRQADHVVAARALGVKPGAVVRRHMLPNSLAPVLVQATLVMASAVIDAAGLTFIGLGAATDDSPEWGQMLGSKDTQNLFDQFPHLAFYPAICIIIYALGFTLMGESLREALDPKSRR